eukprot:CAMPEP_0205938382 /NCGR_PEP_ID=MMETSP1325-20131115/46864_1 /ASSEMBLY_ACC=CAM_ASM_000708 /TAXON_ID=236786 /ORGANISM="Florenciella sp., Strain RCC1007" /LENGTH=41 /DNA_ID= /DNA_START= /DNA_END= /DNA_ORIENTATION=
MARASSTLSSLRRLIFAIMMCLFSELVVEVLSEEPDSAVID